MTARAPTTSRDVLQALRGLWSAPEYATLYEVRDGTGAHAGRSADAVVMSCWPSRGLYAMGVEVKVSRGDWKRELQDVTKSASVQRFCRHWWIAAPAGLIPPHELPATWGLVEVTGERAKVAVPAPVLEAEPPTMAFVASVMRNSAAAHAQRLLDAHADGYAAAEKDLDASALEALRDQLLTATRGASQAQADLQRVQRKLAEHEAIIATYEKVTELSRHEVLDYSFGDARRMLGLARALERHGVGHIAQHLEHLAAGARKLEQALGSDHG